MRYGLLTLNFALVRRLALAATAIVVLATPQLARAQTPGGLAQLASPNDCIGLTSGDTGCSTTAPGLSGTTDVAITPDGKNVYVIGQSDESIAEFARNADGSLSPIGCIAEQIDTETSCSGNATAVGLSIPQAIAISPDGNDVYVAGFDDNDNGDVAEFARNADGTLAQLSSQSCFAEAQDNTSECGNNRGVGLRNPTAIAVSPDGKDVYVADESGPAITKLARAADGSLSQPDGSGDCITEVATSNSDCSSGVPGLDSPDAVVVSPDGNNVYVGSIDSPGTIAEFVRAANGSLSELASPNDCIQEQDDSAECGTNNAIGIEEVAHLAVSPDGKNVYATSPGQTGSIAEFSRDPNAQGALSQLSAPNNCIEEQGSEEGCGTADGLGLNGAFGVAVSPDGANVYVATQADDCCDDAVGEFTRASDGHLTQLASPDQCIDGSGADCDTTGVGLGGGALAISSDNTSVYVIGGADAAEFARKHTLTVSLAGTGSGAVSDGSGGISCPSTCSHAYDLGSQVTLTATPSSGSTFAGWGGACSGTGTCQVTMSANMAVTATFTANASPSPGQPTPVLTGAPTAVTDSGAGFSGSVNPEGLPTTVFFQYGLDKRYSQVGASGANYTQQTTPQSIGSDFSVHNVGPVAVSGLVPNALYHVRLVATNSAGTTFGQDVTFRTARAPNPPPPTLGASFNIAPVSGLVLILIHGHLVPLTQLQQIPLGVVIDSLHGTFQLTTASGSGGSAHDAAAKGKRAKTQRGTFGGAVVKIHQVKGGANRGLTTVMMVESAFKGAPGQALCKAHGAGDAHAARAKKTIQLLHASAKGKFRTSGRYSAATVRGTKWTMTARCDGTLVRDITHSVAVTDFVRHKTVILHAGQSYLAPSRRKHR